MNAPRLTDLCSIERRRESRRCAHGGVALSVEGIAAAMPGQLVDLSACGAGILTTDGNAPILGEHVELSYDDCPTDEDGPESHLEKGIVVNIRRPKRGISRVGIRFFQPNGEGCTIGAPLDTLDAANFDGVTAGDAQSSADPWSIPSAFQPAGAN